MANVFCFGDNIDTDMILPGKYLDLSDNDQLAQYCMEGYQEGFSKKVCPGDIFVAGKNFGCGSSREHAPASIKALGISCIIAVSFARIFYRNAINLGLPLLETEDAVRIHPADVLVINYENGTILNKTQGQVYSFAVFPASIQQIIKAGGMAAYVREKNKR